MSASILICAPKYGGCGCVEESTQWRSHCDGNVLECPDCGEDHGFQLTNDNFNDLTAGLGECGRLRARKLLDDYYAVQRNAEASAKRLWSW
jgi:hypothetical protein